MRRSPSRGRPTLTGLPRTGCRKGAELRIAVISDVHSNLEALTTVLAAIEKMKVDAVYCLGDVVGYNADPEPCLEAVLGIAAGCVRGNHDKAVAGLMDLAWFNNEAREAALWTRKVLGEGSLKRLARLREGPFDPGRGILLCHGSPCDEDEYIYEGRSIAEGFRCLEEEHPGTRICFHGHTHSPLVAVRLGGKGQPRRLATGDRVELDPDSVYLINPGSVGQPRDGIAQASFGILDVDGMTYSTLRVGYPLRETQRKILAVGLPERLARRLGEGR
jgi:predicted phosphodiesterase